MKKIRLNTFETNSSSTHSMVIAPDDQFRKWEQGILYYHDWQDRFASREEIFEDVKRNPENYKYSNLPQFLAFETEEERKNYAEEVHAFSSVDGFIDYELQEIGWETYDHFVNDNYLEVESSSYTTPGGEKLSIVCKFGYDG